MKIGAHVGKENLKKTLEDWGFTTAQIFLSSPKRWAASKLSPKLVAELTSVEAPFFVHSSYLLNPASPNPEVREKTKKSLQEQLDLCALVGAEGLIVHGGQGGKESTVDEAIERWVEVMKAIAPTSKLIIENTAGGNAAPGRHLDSFAKLYESLDFFPRGYCVDTCHSWAGGFGLEELADRLLPLMGEKPSLVHMNSSKDPEGCGRDRHSNLVEGDRQTDLALAFALALEVPVVLETPGEGFVNDVKLLKEKLL